LNKNSVLEEKSTCGTAIFLTKQNTMQGTNNNWDAAKKSQHKKNDLSPKVEIFN